MIEHKFNTGWAVGVVKTVEKKKIVAGQFAVKYRSAFGNVFLDSKTKQGRLPCRQVLGTSCCCKRVNTVEKQSTPSRSLEQFSRLRFEICRLRLRFFVG